MTILVSACLLGENCKYSGGNNRAQAVLDFCAGHTVIPICPERDGGLPTPRPASEIVNGVVMNKLGENVDAQYRAGAAHAVQLAKEHHADLAILQPRSPSCGVTQRYDGTFSGTLIDGQGIAAEALTKAGIRCVDADKLNTI